MPGPENSEGFDVENFLAHYASEFYDPAKAHAYYEQNKKLKGGPAAGVKETPAQRKQRTTTATNQRQALGYANKQISTKRTADLKGAQAAQKARTEAVRKNVEQRTAQIKQKLEAALAKLKAEAESSVKPPKLNTIPPNASPKVRAFLEAQNAKITDAAKKEAATANQKLSTASAAARKAAGEEAHKIGNDMRAAITKARDAYAQSRQQITTKYKNAAVTERKNIQSQVR